MNIHIYVVSGPVDESKNRLPDILCVIQVFINLLHFPTYIFLSILLFFSFLFFVENSCIILLLLSEKLAVPFLLHQKIARRMHFYH